MRVLRWSWNLESFIVHLLQFSSPHTAVSYALVFLLVYFQLNAKQLDKQSVWVKANETAFEDIDIFLNLETMFSTKAPGMLHHSHTDVDTGRWFVYTSN